MIILVRKQHLSGEVSNTSPEQGNTDSAMQYSYQRSVGYAGRLFCKDPKWDFTELALDQGHRLLA